MEIVVGREKKAFVVAPQAVPRSGTALRLSVEGDDDANDDLSVTGLYFQSDRCYDAGASIDLVLELPDGERTHLRRCEAEVVRVARVGKAFNVAVRLLTPSFRETA